MVRTFTKIFIASSLLFGISFLSACIDAFAECPDVQMYYVKSISTRAIDVIKDQYGEEIIYTDSLENQLAFETTNTVEFAALESKPNKELGLIASAKATCFQHEVLNPVLPEKSVFYTDLPLSIDGFSDLLPPRTNLLSIPEIRHLIDFPTTLTFDKAAVTTIQVGDLIGWETANYTFYFEWHTADEIFTDEVTVHLNF